ncbi:MAG: hypothetical protein ABI824_09565 [Acidobacteriota bacterium]
MRLLGFIYHHSVRSSSRASRLGTVLVATTMLVGIAVAGDPARPIAYVAGNLSGISPSNDVMLMVEDKALSLHSGGNLVQIPYSAILKADIGKGRKPVSEPLYKVWTLPKRLSGVNEMQQVVVDYKDPSGETRSATLEMQRATATDVINAIDEARLRQGSASKRWWGDNYWKTSQNPEIAKK